MLCKGNKFPGAARLISFHGRFGIPHDLQSNIRVLLSIESTFKGCRFGPFFDNVSGDNLSALDVKNARTFGSEAQHFEHEDCVQVPSTLSVGIGFSTQR